MQVLDEFSKQVDRIDWPVGSPATIQYTGLDDHLSKYQVKKHHLETSQKLWDLEKVHTRGSSGLMRRRMVCLRTTEKSFQITLGFESTVLCLFIVRIGSFLSSTLFIGNYFSLNLDFVLFPRTPEKLIP